MSILAVRFSSLVVNESEGVAIYSKVLIMPSIRAFQLPISNPAAALHFWAHSFNFLSIADFPDQPAAAHDIGQRKTLHSFTESHCILRESPVALLCPKKPISRTPMTRIFTNSNGPVELF